jgi:predicted CXXCH cytochrome family protein
MDSRPFRLIALGAVCLLVAACPAKLKKAPDAAGIPDALVEAYPGLAETLQDARYVHGPVGANKCMSCHADPEEIGKIRGEEPGYCFDCHAILRGEQEAEGAHMPFAGGACTGCHDVHNSNFPHLLLKEEKELCSQCHDLESRESRAAHAGISALSGCGECHAPHTASGAKLLWGYNLHMPYESKMCDSCHAVSEDGKVNLTGDGLKMCLACHADLSGAQELAQVHPPFMMGQCWTCHSAHRGRARALLPDRISAVCAGCHEDVPLKGHPVMGHPAEDLGMKNPKDPDKPLDCGACHDPHASAHAGLGRADRKEICQWCHQK